MHRRHHCLYSKAKMYAVLCITVLLGVVGLEAAAPKPYLVSLTMSGNSEDTISDALKSAVDWVDAVVLLDTGITDNTVAVAQKVAGSKLIVKPMPWPGAFSKARNTALRMAADMGASWGVFLDTDERFEGETGKVKQFLGHTAAESVTMKNKDLTYFKTRFHRLPLKGKYVGPTHEAFELDPGGTHQLIEGVVFWELSKDEERLRHKAERDINILVKHIAENPTQPRWQYYLGDAYTILGRHEDAVKAFHNCTDLRGWDEEGAWAMFRAAVSLGALSRYDEAVDALAKGMSRHPGIPELPWYAAYLSYKEGRHRTAAQWAQLATVHGCYTGTCPERVGFQYPFARYEGPYDTLRWSLLASGDEAGSEEAKSNMDKASAKRKAGLGPVGHDGHNSTPSHTGESVALPVNKPRIALGFTTAMRPKMFMRTYFSFRARCMDCDMVADWYAVDDGSSEEDLAAMKAIAPNIKWLDKPAGQSGHVASINTLLQVAAGYDFFVWMEDDWYFVRDELLLSKAITVMQANQDVAQVLFNRDYLDTDHEEEAHLAVGGVVHEVSGLKYILHKYGGPFGSEGHKKCGVPAGKYSNCHWPHFSLRPGVWSMKHMSALGPIQAGHQFEHEHGLRFVDKGFKTAFLPNINAIHLAITSPELRKRPHIATDTYSKHGIHQGVAQIGLSAYTLTATSR